MQVVKKPDNKEFTTIYNAVATHEILRRQSNPEAYDKYRQLWKKVSSLAFLTDYPPQLDFELNYSCNFSCSMCTWSVESKNGKGRETWFDFNVYKEIIDDGVPKGLKAVRLNYINEPLIRKDITRFIRYAKEAGVLDIYFSTNGSLLNEKTSKALVGSGLTRLQVSIDAATKETYDSIRSGGDFHEILKNIERFKAIRTEMNSQTPLLRVNFVKTDLNAHELEAFKDYWKDKADTIGVQDFINVNNPADISDFPNDRKKFNCAQPFCHLTIRYNGTILPCCAFFGAEIPIAQLKTKHSEKFSVVENLAMDSQTQTQLSTKTVEEAWKSSEMEFFREIHKAGEYWKHPVCKKCVFSSSHIDETQ